MKNVSSVLRRWLCVLTLSLIVVSPAVLPATQLSLDGVDDYVREADGKQSPAPLDGSIFTAEAWIFPSRLKDMTIVSDSGYALDLLHRIGAPNNGIGIRLSLFNTAGDAFSKTIFSDIEVDKWNHVAGAFDASTNTCYIAVNGNVTFYNPCLNGDVDLEYNQFFGAGISSAGGVGPNSPPRFVALFAGRIAEIRLSNVIRYPSNFNLPVSCFGADGNTLGLWHLDQPVDSTGFMDSSGHGYTLTGFNGAKTGEGPAPPIDCKKPKVELNPTRLVFDNQPVGVASAAQTITLANAGAAPLAITGMMVSGDFQNTDCGSILAANASCSIDVTFTPTASGSRSGRLTIATDAPDSPHAIDLSGVGVEPIVALGPGSLVFGEQPIGVASAAQAITLRNAGAAPLTISSIATAGDFIQNNDCGAALAPAASCRIEVTFKPMASGNRSGQLILTSNAGGSPHTVDLNGAGVAPAVSLSPGKLTFGDQRVGSASAARLVTLTNTGTAPLRLASIAISGNFAQKNTCKTPLGPGAACNISVTFKPTASGNRTGQLTIASNAGGSPHRVNLSGKGSQKFELKISKYGNGGGTVTSSPGGINCGADCKESYSKDKKVKLTAKAKSGSVFLGWSGACSGAASSCQVTLSQAKTVNAIFTKKGYYLLMVSKTGSGGGIVNSSPAGISCGSVCRKSYRKDSLVKLTAKANRGSTFAGWSGACSGKSPSCQVKINRVRSVIANFKRLGKTSYDYWLDDALLLDDSQAPTADLDLMGPAPEREVEP